MFTPKSFTKRRHSAQPKEVKSPIISDIISASEVLVRATTIYSPDIIITHVVRIEKKEEVRLDSGFVQGRIHSLTQLLLNLSVDALF
jgi:hypothetical protein